MILEDLPLNFTGIFAAAAIYFLIGTIWYAPNVFGNRWKHQTQFELLQHEQHPRPLYLQLSSYLGEFIISLIIATFLSLFIQLSRADEIIEGIIVALWVWVGFIATTHFSAVLWGRKTFKSFCIHAGFMLLGLISMGVVIIYTGFNY